MTVGALTERSKERPCQVHQSIREKGSLKDIRFVQEGLQTTTQKPTEEKNYELKTASSDILNKKPPSSLCLSDFVNLQKKDKRELPSTPHTK